MEIQIFVQYSKEPASNKAKQKNATYNPPNTIIFFIVYESGTSQGLNSSFTLNDYLFKGVNLATNVDPDKYLYTGCGIGFDSRSELSLTDGNIDKNVIIF